MDGIMTQTDGAGRPEVPVYIRERNGLPVFMIGCGICSSAKFLPAAFIRCTLYHEYCGKH